MAPIIPSGEQLSDKPVPRRPKSPSRTAQIQVQNRRREYLTRHPSYFDNLEHELADPVLYERLVKRFQSASEREAEGKAKGYGRTLEADLQRGESKLTRLKEGDAAGDSNGDLEHPWEKPAADKAHGLLLWHAFLEERFVHGLDEDFDYKPVDADEDLDTMLRRDAQDAWFDDEEPSWIDEDESSARPAIRQGETGVQDF
ncbi:coiled-coil protein [Fusarium austroafricanum]|uniref:Coiled-coil protein n=1 Tax=Fusarium austroafricanum TaxID=2364996 RepID=A0A8H4KEW4_9HYPO|nr:coiled-coil protein [Fusarium austroafricanum]